VQHGTDGAQVWQRQLLADLPRMALQGLAITGTRQPVISSSQWIDQGTGAAEFMRHKLAPVP